MKQDPAKMLLASLKRIGYVAEANELHELIIREDESDQDDFDISLDENADFSEDDLRRINKFSTTLEDYDKRKAQRLRSQIANNIRRRMR